MRLIDADALLEQMQPVSGFEVNSYAEAAAMAIANAYIKLVEKQPTVQPETNCSEIPNNSDTISRQQAINALAKIARENFNLSDEYNQYLAGLMDGELAIRNLPSAQPERKTGYWFIDRSGKYCCSNCMEPCAGYVMMRPRDKFCKMCGSRNVQT